MPGAPKWRTRSGLEARRSGPSPCTRLCVILPELEIRLHPNPLSECVA